MKIIIIIKIITIREKRPGDKTKESISVARTLKISEK